MKISEEQKLAEHYFELSNQRDLESIEKLLDESTTYSSINTGVFLGREQIMQMKQSFYSSFKDMNWKIHSIVEERPAVILFDFTFTGTTNESKSVTREGLEYVIVYDNKLQHIEVRNK